ncbi:MAG: hypothetical protein K2F83_00330, partial [Oscillospiraceae bacterium]|nr:hypothetical protein [Oscillospiraceae bacterium]
MKKYLPILMLALLLTACGGPGADVPTLSPGETPEGTQLPPPTETPTVEPTETPGGFSVYTDWSKLEPYEPKKAVYTRRYEGFTDTLIPSNDYGPLIPFAGTALTTMGEWGGGVHPYDYHLYGLVTTKGEVVVDPVFTEVGRVYDHKEDDMRSLGQLPVYVLTKAVQDEDGEIVDRSALCALDGSWCTDYLYHYDWQTSGVFGEGTGIIIAKGRNRLAIVDLSNGREQVVIDLTPYLGEGGSFGWRAASGGYITVNVHQWGSQHIFYLLFAPDGTLLLQLESGEAHEWVGKYAVSYTHSRA